MKSEVRALEQAVCDLLTKLDLLLTAQLGLRLFGVDRGIHMSMPDHLSGDDAFVTIRPTGWPRGSFIHARLYRSRGIWSLYEGGEINACHLDIPINNLRFEPAENIMGITLHAFDEQGGQFVKDGYRRLIGSLQKDLEKLRK